MSMWSSVEQGCNVTKWLVLAKFTLTVGKKLALVLKMGSKNNGIFRNKLSY